MTSENVKRTVAALSEQIGPRPPGSAAELEAARFMRAAFEEMGLECWIEPFESPSHRAVGSAIRVAGEDAPFPSLPAQFSAGGEGSGELVFLGMMGKSPLEPRAVGGKVGLLIPAGSHAEKIDYLSRLEANGLEGLIVVSPYLDNIQTKIVRYPEIARMPIAVVSMRTATRLRRCEGRRAEMSVCVAGGERRESQNVVARVRGSGDRWLAVSAHCDTAAHAPGALDNASGAAVLIEVARRFVDARPRATLLFVATGSEEHGRLDGVGAGAQAFYDRREAELETCLGHIEIDDVGNVLGTPEVFIGGSKPFRDRVLGAVGPGIRYGGSGGVGCDHGAAEQRGVPWAWFCDCEFPCPHYHSPEDTMEFFDAERAAAFVDFGERALAALSAAEPAYRFVREGKRRIRPARHRDIPAMLEITRLAFGPVSLDRMREDFFGEPLGGKPWHEHKNAAVEASLKRHILQAIVCEVDGAVVGFATYSLDPALGIASIANNAVRPDVQGQGIGTFMQQEIDRRLREEGYTRFQVTTLSNDVAAQRMYERLGYTKCIDSCCYLRRDDEERVSQ